MMDVARASRHKGKLFDALSVVLQHPAVTADQRSVCTLQRVSKTVRSLVQQLAAGATDVSCTLRITNLYLPTLPDLAAWLSQHLELVRSLHINWCFKMAIAPELERLFEAAAQQLIESSLKGSVGTCSKQTTAESAAATVAKQACRLHSYRINLPVTVGILAALPGDSLTQLHVVVPKGDDWVSSIRGLRHLRDLRLEPEGWRGELCYECMPTIHQLTQLSKLILIHPSQEAVDNLQLLPKQLEHLFLAIGDPNTSPGSVTLSLQHLVQLEQLELISRHNLECIEGSALPAQLKHLQLDMACPVIRALALTRLRNLETLQMDTTAENASVSSLAVLDKIKHMSLSSKRSVVDPDEAAVWKRLPSLQELAVQVPDHKHGDWKVLLQHLSATTQLTKLQISSSYLSTSWTDSDLAICDHITSLTQLRELSLVECFFESGVRYLTALKGLTHLDVFSRSTAVDESTLAVLASELTNLQRLEIACCPLDSGGSVALPVLGKLTKLEHLVLHDTSMLHGLDTPIPGAAAREGLLMLTGLVKLTKLVGFQMAGPVALESFWSLLRAHQHSAQQ